MENLNPGAHRLRETVCADGHHHDFLNIEGVISMGAAVEDVHHRGRQHMGMNTAHVSPERLARRLSRSTGHSQADTEDGISAQARFVVGPVQADQVTVNAFLVEGITPGKDGKNLGIDALNRGADTLAVPACPAITAFHRLISPC